MVFPEFSNGKTYGAVDTVNFHFIVFIEGMPKLEENVGITVLLFVSQIVEFRQISHMASMFCHPRMSHILELLRLLSALLDIVLTKLMQRVLRLECGKSLLASLKVECTACCRYISFNVVKVLSLSYIIVYIVKWLLNQGKTSMMFVLHNSWISVIL